ncbi:TetR/AcrR family transcriptional regulator [Gemmatimonas sp.]
MPSAIIAAKALPAQERRASIVASVVELAATRNPAEISTTAIAQQLGLTQGALFKHFASKDALLVAVIQWVEQTLNDRLDAAELNAESPLQALERVFHAHVQFVTEFPGAPRIVFGELQRGGGSLPRQAVRTLQARYGGRIRRLLTAAQAQQQLAVDLDVGAATTLFVGSIQGLVVQALLQDDFSHPARQATGLFALYRAAVEGNR